jgi:hypothetical protein
VSTDVGASLEHAAGDVGVGLFLQLDVDARVAGEHPGQDRRQDVGHGGGVGEDAQVPAQAAAVFLEVGAQVLDLPKDGAGMMEKGLARRREPHPARLAHQQGQARLLLDAADAGAGRGEREMLAGRCPGQLALLGDGREQPQVGQVELHGR